MINASGILLAGGRSSRMGRDKALLPFGSSTLIEHMARKMLPCFREVIIVSARRRQYAVEGTVCIEDSIPDAGPLGGLYAGLSAAQHQSAFVTACDMPNFSPELARLLLNRQEGYDAAIPLYRMRPEPLCAVYSVNLLPSLYEFIRKGGRKMRDFIQTMKVDYINENEMEKIVDPARVFLNINSPGDIPEDSA